MALFQNCCLLQRNLSQLLIDKVAIEVIDDVEPPKGILNAKNVIVYIAYKDLGKARICEPLDRKAIVRRVFDETTGGMTLLGDYWSGEKAVNTGRCSNGLPRKEIAVKNKDRPKKQYACLG